MRKNSLLRTWVCVGCCGMVIIVLFAAFREKNGWDEITRFRINSDVECAILVHVDIDNQNRAVAWDLISRGKRIDSGFFGVINVDIPLNSLQVSISYQPSKETWAVCELSRNEVWGILRWNAATKKLIALDNNSREAFDMIELAEKLNGIGSSRWIQK